MLFAAPPAVLLLASAFAPSATATTDLPAIRHVFVIVLENSGYTTTFGNPATDPYLAQSLPADLPRRECQQPARLPGPDRP